MRRYIADKVGEKVRLARKKLGITQQELGSRAGLDITSVNRIENGKINPTLTTLNRIARVLGVRPGNLLP